MSSLQLRRARRQGGGGKTEREFLDFVVDGRSLQDTLGVTEQIGGIGWGMSEGQRLYIDRLLMKEPTDAPSGRVPIYICAECGDIGCGAVTARIEKTATDFMWSDFAFENSYDGSITDTESFRSVGPFSFNKTEYWELLNSQRKNL